MLKRWIVWIFTGFLAACTAPPIDGPVQPPVEPPLEPATTAAAYPHLGTAPELVGDVWLNTDTPLRLADLKGKVVLIDMWTFG